jgi:hypothetical protein
MVQTLDERRMKIWRTLLKELKEPVRPYGVPESKKDIWIYAPECPYSHNGVVVESRYIWWLNYPDDPILTGEVIHHINGNRQDNRIENLAKLPWSGHARIHKDMREGKFNRMIESNKNIKD